MDIGAWGDSITYGSCDSAALGWIGRLRKARRPGEDEIATYERGVCGDTSLGLLKRFGVELDSIIFKLDAVIFAIGMNDCSQSGEEQHHLVPLSEFKEYVSKLIETAQAKGVTVYLLGITNVDESRTVPLPKSRTGKSFRNSSIIHYNEVLEGLGQKYSVGFINVFGILTNNNLADGLHPNASGYDKMFKIISKELT